MNSRIKGYRNNQNPNGSNKVKYGLQLNELPNVLLLYLLPVEGEDAAAALFSAARYLRALANHFQNKALFLQEEFDRDIKFNMSLEALQLVLDFDESDYPFLNEHPLFEPLSNGDDYGSLNSDFSYN